MAAAVSFLSVHEGDLKAPSAVIRKGELQMLCQGSQG